MNRDLPSPPAPPSSPTSEPIPILQTETLRLFAVMNKESFEEARKSKKEMSKEIERGLNRLKIQKQKGRKIEEHYDPDADWFYWTNDPNEF